MRQQIFTLLFSVITAMSAQSTPSAGQPISIVAVVNNQIITRQDLDHRLKFTFLGSPKMPSNEDLKKAEMPVLTKMIEEILQVQHAAQFEVTADDDELQQQIAVLEKNNNLKPGDLLRQMQAAGIAPETLHDLVRAQVAWGKFIQMLRPMARVGKTDVETHMNQSKGREQRRYLLSEIVVPAQGTSPEALAQQVFGQLKQGKPFALIAAEISVSPSAAVGGDIGWVDEDQLAPEIRQALNQMPVESISPPLPLGSHLHLVAYRAKKDYASAHQKLTMRQIEIPFVGTMTEAQRETQIKKWTDQVQKAQTCAAFTKLADIIPNAILSIHDDVNPFQMTGGLEKVLKDLEVSKVSEALPHPEGKTKGVQFFMICERHNVSDQEADEKLKKEIQQQLEHKSFASLVNRRLKIMKQNAHIEVRL